MEGESKQAQECKKSAMGDAIALREKQAAAYAAEKADSRQLSLAKAKKIYF